MIDESSSTVIKENITLLSSQLYFDFPVMTFCLIGKRYIVLVILKLSKNNRNKCIPVLHLYQNVSLTHLFKQIYIFLKMGDSITKICAYLGARDGIALMPITHAVLTGQAMSNRHIDNVELGYKNIAIDFTVLTRPTTKNTFFRHRIKNPITMRRFDYSYIIILYYRRSHTHYRYNSAFNKRHCPCRVHESI